MVIVEFVLVVRVVGVALLELMHLLMVFLRLGSGKRLLLMGL